MPRQLTPTDDLPTLTEGDDYSFAVSFTDRSGSPIDITGWTVSMTVAEDDGTPIIEKDITTHDDATGGKTSWSVPASDTSGLSGTKRYDIQVVKSDGTTRTVALGTVGFLDGATDRAISGSGGSGVGASTGAAINVTLDGDDSISLSIQGLTNYTDSDVLDAINGAAISPGELSVNGTGPVTGIWGDSNEYAVFESHYRKRIASKTSQDWSFYLFEVDTPRILGDKNKKTGIAEYYIAFAANMGREDNDDTATTSMRFFNVPSSETSITGTTTANNDVVSPLVPVSDSPTDLTNDVTAFPLVEAKTDKGEAAFRSVTFYLVGEIA